MSSSYLVWQIQYLIQLEVNDFINEFAFCDSGLSNKFQITQKLAEREEETQILLAAFERVHTRT